MNKIKMIVKNNLRYVGPRAIFDPNFIPPELLFRKKEEHSLFSILNDSISDDFSINILYQGIQGIGKKAIIQKVLKDLLIQNRNYSNVKIVNIECREKTLHELIIYLLAEIKKLLRLDLKIETIINLGVSRLWSIFKLACKKFNGPLFLLFNNIENLKPGIFNKFISLSKESNISLISTVNKVLRASTLELLSDFDIKKKPKIFSYKELHSILQHRASLTFPHEIDKELIDFMTDLTCEHYAPVPGKGIELFRDIYPVLKDNRTIEQSEMLEICHTQFDTFRISDDFSMLTYFSEEDLLTTLFLDNLSNYFLKNSKYYIKMKNLKDIYEISCENLEYEKNLEEFNEIVNKINNLGILNVSRKNNNLSKKSLYNQDVLKCDLFFMVINPYQLKSIVDVLFGKL
ncbi:MAG: hypothetical protein ACFFBP_15230 [Promethearchaeota archaeon]